MTTSVYLKLRANIELDEDVQLALKEVQAFFEKVVPISDLDELACDANIPQEFTSRNSRSEAPYGFLCYNPQVKLDELIKSISFIQEVWYALDELPKRSANDEIWLGFAKLNDRYYACALPFMSAVEIFSYLKTPKFSANEITELVKYLCNPKEKSATYANAVGRTNTSAPHVHGLHKYKAKFFPRMVRGLVSKNVSGVPTTPDGKVILLDPFVGSGTALIEASLLGFESIGIDIDRLSCKISKAKYTLLTADPAIIRNAIEEFQIDFNFQKARHSEWSRYSFPPWIAKKFERSNALEIQENYEREIENWLYAISRVESDDIRNLLEVCLSDALTRKFNIRMMGTGVGRFALEIRNRSLTNLMTSNLHKTIILSHIISNLIHIYKLELKLPLVIESTAKQMPIRDDSVSMIITSPPYLPASSGREDYLVGKSISITALNLMSCDELTYFDSQSVGSMKAEGNAGFEGLPPEVKELYEWLEKDELRKIKAKPTVLYYQDLRQALLESHRVLMPNGLAIFIIGKESVFYRYKERNILYTVPCDDIFRKLTLECGFTVEEQFDVKLNKKHGNARPRSRDDYYESVFILRKTDKCALRLK